MIVSQYQRAIKKQKEAENAINEDMYASAYYSSYDAIMHCLNHILIANGKKISENKDSILENNEQTWKNILNTGVFPQAYEKVAKEYYCYQNDVNRIGGCWADTFYEEKNTIIELVNISRKCIEENKDTKKRTHGSVKVIQRTSVFPIEEILDIILSDIESLVIDGNLVNLNKDQHSKDRYRCFKENGTVCKKCGKKAQYFALELVESKSYNGWTLGLYGTHNDEEIYFTKDHIIAKSLGGPDSLENYQTFCWKCNSLKGNRH